MTTLETDRRRLPSWAVNDEPVPLPPPTRLQAFGRSAGRIVVDGFAQAVPIIIGVFLGTLLGCAAVVLLFWLWFQEF